MIRHRAQTPLMTVTVRQLIEERAAGLVGREDERAVLHGLLEADGPVIVFVAWPRGRGQVHARPGVRERSPRPRRDGAPPRLPRDRADGARIPVGAGGTQQARFAEPDRGGVRLDSLGERIVLVLDT